MIMVISESKSFKLAVFSVNVCHLSVNVILKCWQCLFYEFLRGGIMNLGVNINVIANDTCDS